MRSKTRFDVEAVDERSLEKKQTAGKSIYGVSHLPPDVSELIYKTCSLAASQPSAVRILASSMRRIYAQVEALCDGGELYPNLNLNNPATSRDDLTITELPCTDSPALKSRMAYLSKALEEPGVTSPYCSDRRPTAAMMNAVQLRSTDILERCDKDGQPSDALLEFEKLDDLVETLTKVQSCEVLQIAPSGEGSRHEDLEVEKVSEDVVGRHVEVYCKKKQIWRSAYISSEDPGNRVVLVYFDGIVESVLLKTLLWRPIW